VRTALITGGSGGIGKACARKLCALGYDVVLTARREAPLREAADELGAHFVVADASQPDSFTKALETIGSIDLVVHAAGVLDGTYARKQTFDQWRSTLSANLDSCFVVTSAALPKMQAGSRFVFISSSAAHEPMPGQDCLLGVQGGGQRVRTCARPRGRS
jgi:NADP-dependent 3-hydroxy acid dehydrogenase YdfG